MKKIIYITGILIILGLGIYAIYPSKANTYKGKNTYKNLQISKEELKETEFLQNKKAVVYLSTTADQDFDGKGASYAVFIDNHGKSQGLQMKGLELGSMAINKKNILLEEKDRVRIVGEDYKEFPMSKKQYTGEITGYLKNKNIFFSIYNSGINKGSYNSDVRFGNEKGFKTSTIPFYIASSGLNKTDLSILTHDVKENEFNLKKVVFNKDVKTQQVTKLNTQKDVDMNALSPILADQKYYYFILSSTLDDYNAKVYLYQINKINKKQKVFKLLDYKDMKDLVATDPYNVKNSAYLYKKELYYVNGLGDVYTFNTSTQKIKKKFSLINANQSKIRHNEETYFKDNYLYVFRYNEKKSGKYYLEQYSLDSGELIKSTDIQNFDKLSKSIRGKNIYSYDLKVLQ
ncbi:hypothetical protein [Rummeliibacillus stabekisii]|uniref:hypothetical protein n=1 Tax=Rummeliibacillus stabekisii TaxID=241244 RepID=UPI00117104C4|nr:hypothetical protein [Rummeliibacillus stabekisii]MBB5171539.1 hypothetical protein [Rummeliibacillus stabekisii]GEL05506.1 hypothetical protein RST01_21330 [Rummeliibacillus stabekisii]